MRISRSQLIRIINEELTRAGFKPLDEAAYKPSGLFKKTDLYDDESDEKEPVKTPEADKKDDDEDDTDYNPW